MVDRENLELEIEAIEGATPGLTSADVAPGTALNPLRPEPAEFRPEVYEFATYMASAIDPDRGLDDYLEAAAAGLQFMDENPWMRAEANKDVTSLLALTGLEQAVSPLESIGFSPTDDFWRSALELVADNKYRISTQAQVRATPEAVSVNQDLKPATAEDFARVAERFGFDEGTPESFVQKKVRGVLASYNDLLGKERTVTTFHHEESGRLLTEITYPNAPSDTIDIVLDEGTSIESNEDLVWEMIMARALAHTIVDDDGIKGRQTLIGLASEFTAGTAMRVIDSGLKAVTHSEMDEIHTQTAVEQRAKEIVNTPIDRDELGISLTAAARAEQHASGVMFDGQMTAGQVRADLAAMNDEEILAMSQDIYAQGGLTEEKVIDQLQAAADTRGPIEGFRDELLMTVARELTRWDHILHEGGIRVLATIEGAQEFISEDIFGVDDSGYRSWSEAYRDTTDADSLAEYWGLEDSDFAGWINLGGSLLFDPFLWVTPGGKGLAQAATRRLTTIEGTHEAVRLVTSQKFLRTTYERLQKGNLVGLMGTDLDDAAKLTLSKNLPATYDEFQEVVRKSMPAEAGFSMLDPASGEMRRRTAVIVANLASENDSAATTMLRRAFGVFPDSPTINLGSGFVDDIEEWIITRAVGDGVSVATDPRMKNWYVRLLQGVDDMRNGRVGSGLVSLSDASARMTKVSTARRTLMSNTSNEVKRFGTQRAHLSELTNALTDARATGDAVAVKVLESGDALRIVRRDLRNANARLTRATAAGDRARIDAAQNAVDNLTRELDEMVAWKTAWKEARGFEAKSLDSFGFAADDATYARLSKEFQMYQRQLDTLNKQWDLANRAYGISKSPHNPRQLSLLLDEFVSEWGDEIAAKIPEFARDTANGLYLDGSARHAWNLITGGKAKFGIDEGSFDEMIALLADPGGADIAALGDNLAELLNKSSFAELHGMHAMPASAEKILAFQKMGNADKWARKVLRTADSRSPVWAMEKTQIGIDGVLRFRDFFQRQWAMNLLLNPATIWRSNLDEPARLLETTGRFGKAETLATDGLDPTVVAKLKELGDKSTSIGVTVKQFGGAGQLSTGAGAASARQTLTPFERNSAARYAVVEVGERGHTDAVRFMLEGIVGHDPIMQQYAKFVLAGDKDGFVRWYLTDGARYSKVEHVRADVTGRLGSRNRVEAAAAEAVWDSREHLLDRIVGRFDLADAANARKALLANAAEETPLPKWMPRKYNGPAMGANQSRKRFTEKAFDLAYGGPGSVRGGLIYESRYQDLFETFVHAKARNGRLLTPEWTARFTGQTVDEATDFLRNLSQSSLDNFLEATGMTTYKQIHAAADRVARRYSKSMMYQPGAASLVGKKFQRFFPFAPAQMDYLGWYGRRMTKAMEVGLNPGAKKVLQQIPGMDTWMAGRRFWDVPIQPSVGGKAIPLNLRLAGRVAAAGGAAARTQIDELEAGERAGADALSFPLQLLESSTFFPLQFGEMMLVDLVPAPGGLGALPLYALPMFTDEGDEGFDGLVNDIYQASEVIWPALGWNQADQFSLNAVGDAVLPSTPMSVRGFAEKALRTAAAWKMPWETAENVLNFTAYPPGFQRAFKIDIMNTLRDTDTLLDTTLIGRGERDELIRSASLSALQATVGNEWWDYVSRLPFGAFVDADDYLGGQAEAYQGLVENIDVLWRAGIVGDADRNNLNDFWVTASAKDATREDIRQLTDHAFNIISHADRDWQDWLIVHNKEIAVNLVSAYRGTLRPDGRPANPDHVLGDGRLNLPGGPDGTKLFREGKADGWIIPKSTQEITDDILDRVADAHRRYALNIWTEATRSIDNPDGLQTLNIGQQRDLNFQPTITLGEDHARALRDLGVDIDAGNMPRIVLAEAIYDYRFKTSAYNNSFTTTQSSLLQELKTAGDQNAELGVTDGVNDFLKNLDDIEKFLDNEDKSYDELPLATREYVTEQFNRWVGDIDLGITEDEYNREFGRRYGLLSWEAPEFPPLDEVAVKFDVAPGSVRTIDGDTFYVPLGGSDAVVRLVGINADDYNSANAARNDKAIQQSTNLEILIAAADDAGLTVSFGNPDPERFGTISEVEEGNKRLLLTLYIDGEAVVDENIFTVRNPTGVSPQGDGVPAEWMDRDFVKDYILKRAD